MLLHAAAAAGVGAAAAAPARPSPVPAAAQPVLMLRHLGRRALSLLLPHAAAAGSGASRAGLRQPATVVVAAAAAGSNRSSLSTATAASSNSDDSSVSSSVQHAQTLLDTVAKAIEYEARLSYPNAQGREHSFADFASGALQEVATEDGLEQAGAHSSSSLGALQQQLQQASQSLFGYGSLDGEGRKQLLQQLQAGVLQQARQLLAAPSSTQPRDHAGATSTASISSSSSEHSSSGPQQQAAAGRRLGPLPRPGSRQQQHVQNAAEPAQAQALSAPQPQQQQQQLPSSPHPPRPRSPGLLPILRPAAAAAVPSVQQQHPRPQPPPPAPGAAQQQQSPRKPLLPLRAAAQQQQQQPLQPTVLPPAAAAQAPPASSSRHVGPLAPVRRIAAMQGPNPPRQHMPYPTRQTPALEQHEARQQQLQQQPQQQQQQLHVPAWQLYFPLPEALGGPPSPPSTQPQQPEAVAAPPDAAAAALASSPSSPDGASSPDEGDAAGGSSSGRRRRRSTQNSDATWDAFLAAAMHAQEWERKKQQHMKKEAAGLLKQRSDSWLRLRESRLTGSALANMLSWFGKEKNEQVRLWKEKLKLQAPPPPNDKMKYGTRQEPHALASYQHLAPHETLADMGFAVWGTDDAHDWLAASPDGLITCAGGLEQVLRQQGGSSGGQQQQQGEEPAGVSVAEWVRQQTGSSLEGVLEIKCPYKASPNAPQPFLPHRADAYYMPQVQVLCEVLDREWAVVFYWSEELGSHMTLIHRDRAYFALLWQAMVDFWWRHVVPAKLALDAYPASKQAVEARYAPGLHPYRDVIVRLSEAMVAAAPQRTFTPEQTRAAASRLSAAILPASDVDRSELCEVSGRVAIAASAELGAD